MSAASALARARVFAQSLMVDRVTIRRQTGSTEDDNGVITPVYTDLYVDRACRIQIRGAWGQSREVGEAQVVLLQAELQLPHTVTGLQVDDEAVVTASAHDAELVGRVLRVRDIPDKTHATMRRYMITEVTG